jgi:predicted nuclease with TOPRIM domain
MRFFVITRPLDDYSQTSRINLIRDWTDSLTKKRMGDKEFIEKLKKKLNESEGDKEFIEKLKKELNESEAMVERYDKRRSESGGRCEELTEENEKLKKKVDDLKCFVSNVPECFICDGCEEPFDVRTDSEMYGNFSHRCEECYDRAKRENPEMEIWD